MTNHESRIANHGFFVTGTDTGVGKTAISAALLHALASRGFACVGMKPVASGAESRGGELVNQDVEQLIAAANVAAPRHDVNPYCFPDAIAPHIAAQRAGVRIDARRIESCYRRLAALADVVVVEGVGGFRVPLGADGDTAQLAVRLDLPVVLVVGLRLGCLNHALLTAEAISARGLRLAGWVANSIDPALAAADENVGALEALLAAPLLGRVAFTAPPRRDGIARAIDTHRLVP